MSVVSYEKFKKRIDEYYEKVGCHSYLQAIYVAGHAMHDTDEEWGKFIKSETKAK